jgi:hypothetical protein
MIELVLATALLGQCAGGQCAVTAPACDGCDACVVAECHESGMDAACHRTPVRTTLRAVAHIQPVRRTVKFFATHQPVRRVVARVVFGRPACRRCR